ncbi:MAG: DUF3575 domain-containing protein [Tannerellaceae bacterium]
MKKSTLILNVLFLIFSFQSIQGQKIALKTNLLYGGIAQAPNLGLEVALSDHYTLDISGGYNPWNRKGSIENNKKLVHWIISPQARYWFCEKYNGHFIGLNLLASKYNISEHNLPWLFGKHSDQYRFEGTAIGGGFSYGYQWILSSRWSVEGTLGLGYARLWYDKYPCQKCAEMIERGHRNYWGPVNAGISLIYVVK